MSNVARTNPYRMLAVVPREEPPLRKRVEIMGGHCPACGLTRTFNNKPPRLAQDATIKERFCSGGRFGFLWLRVCRERRPHMHQFCTLCGARWIAAPAEDASYE